MDIDGKIFISVFLILKKIFELKVINDRNINIDILYDGKEVKVDIKWFVIV